MLIAKWFTRASRVRIVIAKFDGRWNLPGGPYPIPELVALVAGITFTLFLLPRTGHPFITGLVGAGFTIAAVVTMRQMPYSPVPFPTRMHRLLVLFTNPVTVSFSDAPVADLISVVRPDIQIIDFIPRSATPARHTTESTPMFTPQPPVTAGLFS